MRIPDGASHAFRAAQRHMFGTQEVSWHKQKTVTDNRGVKETTFEAEPEFSYSDCNVIDTFDQADITAWGLRNGENIRVSRADGLPVGTGDFVKWNDRMFRVQQRDDGKLYGAVICERWLK